MTSATDRLRGIDPGSRSQPLPRRRRLSLSVALVSALLCGGPLPPADATPQAGIRSGAAATGGRDTGRYTGLPLPRFAALRSHTVNLRRGPGRRYPIEWVLRRRLLPVEIMREFQAWRFVRIPDGTKGWVHRALLFGRRSFMVRGFTAALRRAPRPGAQVVALLRPGVIGRLMSCKRQSAWCRAEVAGHTGYLKRTGFFGTSPGETIAD